MLKIQIIFFKKKTLTCILEESGGKKRERKTFVLNKPSFHLYKKENGKENQSTTNSIIPPY